MKNTLGVSLDVTTEAGRKRAGIKPWRVGYFRDSTSHMSYALVYASSFAQAMRVAEAMLTTDHRTWVSVCTAHPWPALEQQASPAHETEGSY